MTLGDFLSNLVGDLASVRGSLAIEVLNHLKLPSQVFDECLDELVCHWVANGATSSGKESVTEFSWFDHLKSESAAAIKSQLDLVLLDLDKSEQSEIQITILYRAGLICARCGGRSTEEIDKLSRLLRDYFGRDSI